MHIRYMSVLALALRTSASVLVNALHDKEF